MSEHSSVHGYMNWAKQRIDEMDATLASLEAKASQVKAEAKPRSEELLNYLKEQRDEFRAKIEAQTRAGAARTETTKSQLESLWSDFETQVQTYFDTVGKQMKHQHATFEDIAAAQVQAWREAAD